MTFKLVKIIFFPEKTDSNYTEIPIIRQLLGIAFKPSSDNSFTQNAWHICLEISLFRDLKKYTVQFNYYL